MSYTKRPSASQRQVPGVNMLPFFGKVHDNSQMPQSQPIIQPPSSGHHNNNQSEVPPFSSQATTAASNTGTTSQQRSDGTQSHQNIIKTQIMMASMDQQQPQTITVTVIPCGRDDPQQNGPSEQPYELTIPRHPNDQNNLKDMFLKSENIWRGIFKPHLSADENKNKICPNFSVYRTPFDADQDSNRAEFFLHILYMKSTEKTLTRNYNAQELELFCHNRFYGPLVVAHNQSKQPYQLVGFTLQDLQNIESINRSFQNKSIKDDFVPKCLMDCQYLNVNLNANYVQDNRFLFYLFHYKTSWCSTKKDSHDSKSCIYAHHMRDFRRPPEIFKYAPEDCETLIRGLSWDMCQAGLKCPKCHTTVERLYHPDKYKRIQCDKQRCNKLEICAFYHNMRERNQALKLCKNYRKAASLKKQPNVNLLHKELQLYYKSEGYLLQQQSELAALNASPVTSQGYGPNPMLDPQTSQFLMGEENTAYMRSSPNSNNGSSPYNRSGSNPPALTMSFNDRNYKVPVPISMQMQQPQPVQPKRRSTNNPPIHAQQVDQFSNSAQSYSQSQKDDFAYMPRENKGMSAFRANSGFVPKPLSLSFQKGNQNFIAQRQFQQQAVSPQAQTVTRFGSETQARPSSQNHFQHPRANQTAASFHVKTNSQDGMGMQRHAWEVNSHNSHDNVQLQQTWQPVRTTNSQDGLGLQPNPWHHHTKTNSQDSGYGNYPPTWQGRPSSQDGFEPQSSWQNAKYNSQDGISHNLNDQTGRSQHSGGTYSIQGAKTKSEETIQDIRARSHTFNEEEEMPTCYNVPGQKQSPMSTQVSSSNALTGSAFKFIQNFTPQDNNRSEEADPGYQKSSFGSGMRDLGLQKSSFGSGTRDLGLQKSSFGSGLRPKKQPAGESIIQAAFSSNVNQAGSFLHTWDSPQAQRAHSPYEKAASVDSSVQQEHSISPTFCHDSESEGKAGQKRSDDGGGSKEPKNLPCEFSFLEDEDCFFNLAEKVNRQKSKTEFKQRAGSEVEASEEQKEVKVINKDVREAARQLLQKLQPFQEVNKFDDIPEASQKESFASRIQRQRPLAALALTFQNSKDSAQNDEPESASKEIDLLLNQAHFRLTSHSFQKKSRCSGNCDSGKCSLRNSGRQPGEKVEVIVPPQVKRVTSFAGEQPKVEEGQTESD